MSIWPDISAKGRFLLSNVLNANVDTTNLPSRPSILILLANSLDKSVFERSGESRLAKKTSMPPPFALVKAIVREIFPFVSCDTANTAANE